MRGVRESRGGRDTSEDKECRVLGCEHQPERSRCEGSGLLSRGQMGDAEQKASTVQAGRLQIPGEEGKWEETVGEKEGRGREAGRTGMMTGPKPREAACASLGSPALS